MLGSKPSHLSLSACSGWFWWFCESGTRTAELKKHATPFRFEGSGFQFVSMVTALLKPWQEGESRVEGKIVAEKCNELEEEEFLWISAPLLVCVCVCVFLLIRLYFALMSPRLHGKCSL